MRYTLFIKCPNVPYDLYEGNDLDSHMKEAKRLAKKHPHAVITVCDRQEDRMLFKRDGGEHEDHGVIPRGGFSLSGMFD